MEFPINRILVTGGCGFIGANFIRLALDTHPDLSITNLDALTYAGNPDNLADLIDDQRYRVHPGRYRRPNSCLRAHDRPVV